MAAFGKKQSWAHERFQSLLEAMNKIGQKWSDQDGYLLLGWIWVGGRAALILASSIALLVALPKWPDWLSLAWVGAVALVVINDAKIVQQELRYGYLPRNSRLALGAALDVLWVVVGYVATGLAPLPFPAVMVALIALHGALLPLGGVIISSTVTALLVAGLQAFSSTVASEGLSTGGQLIFVLGLGLVAGVVGSRLRAATWAVLRLKGAVRDLVATSEATVRALPLGMIVIRPDGSIERTVGQLEGVFQKKNLEILHAELRVAESGYRRAFMESLENEGSWQGEDALECEGEAAWVEWSIVTRNLPDVGAIETEALTAGSKDGRRRDMQLPQVARVVIVLRDITDSHRAEQAERAAVDAKNLAAMSADLAHEIRNPLSALRSAAEQLASTESLSKEDRDVLAQIVDRESTRLNRFIGDFLNYARLDVSTGEIIPIHKGAQEALDLIKRAMPTAEIDALIEEDVLSGANELVVRVTANLLTNAVQYSTGSDKNIELRGEKKAEGYMISVRDYGPGVAVSERERIFMPFYTTRSKGNGLGLSMAARAAGLLGGRLWIETPPGCSDTGEGAIFKLLIPRKSQ